MVYFDPTLKWSQLVELVDRYSEVTYSDEYLEVRYGCDCGCGGDLYSDNPEDWDKMVESNSKTLEEVIKFCEENGIEYDGVN